MVLRCAIVVISLVCSCYGFSGRSSNHPSMLAFDSPSNQPFQNQPTSRDPGGLKNINFQTRTNGFNTGFHSLSSFLPSQKTIKNPTFTSMEEKTDTSTPDESFPTKTLEEETPTIHQDPPPTSEREDTGTSTFDEEYIEQMIDNATRPLKEQISQLKDEKIQLRSQVMNLQDLMKQLKSKHKAQDEKCTVCKKELKNLQYKLQQQSLLMTKMTKHMEKINKTHSEVKCQKENKPVLGDGCPKDFINDIEHGICYRVVTDAYGSYALSQKYCSEHYGGALAVLNTWGKFSAVQQEANRKRPGVNLWVGIRTVTGNQMQWTDGSRIAKNMWTPGEPNSAREKCGEMSSDHGFRFNDSPCKTGNMMVCEVKIKRILGRDS